MYLVYKHIIVLFFGAASLISAIFVAVFGLFFKYYIHNNERSFPSSDDVSFFSWYDLLLLCMLAARRLSAISRRILHSPTLCYFLYFLVRTFTSVLSTFPSSREYFPCPDKSSSISLNALSWFNSHSSLSYFLSNSCTS